MRRHAAKLAMAVFLLASAAAPAWGQVALPDRPRYYVEDLANVIDAGHEQALKGVLQELEQKTGVQYIILTVDTTGGRPIADFSIDLAHNKWRLGQAGKDNGFLFVLASADRSYRFTPGYGLEGFLTDQYLGRVGREVLVPHLQANNYSEGIYQANLQVVARIADEENVTLTGMPVLPRRVQPPEQDRPAPCCGTLLILLFILFMIGGMGGRMGWGWFVLPFMFGGFGRHGGYGRSGSYGGGSFGGSFGGFGGSFGGFGGGGGGGFSGGGAGGHW